MLETLKPDPELAAFSALRSLDREGTQVFPRALPLRADSPSRGSASAQERGEALDLIFIEGLTGETIIGINDDELHQPQLLVIDVCAGIPHAPACTSDQIEDTIHYGELRRRLLRLLVEHQVKLVEAFAELVAKVVLDEFRAQWVRVRVAKPRKYADVQSLGVIIERRRVRVPLPLKLARPTA